MLSSLKKHWLLIGLISVIILLLLLTIPLSSYIGARLLRHGNPRLTVHQDEPVSIEIKPSNNVKKLEICDDKRRRLITGNREYKNCSTLKYNVTPGTKQVTTNLPDRYSGRAVVITRDRDKAGQLLDQEPADEKIALWVAPVRVQSVANDTDQTEQDNSNDNDNDNDNDDDDDNSPVVTPGIVWLSPSAQASVVSGQTIDVRAQLNETDLSQLTCQQWFLDDQPLETDDWADSQSPDLSEEECL